MADLSAIVEQLSGLTIMEAADLVKKLEEKWGVSAAAAPVMMAAAGPAAAAVEEKTEFTVVLLEAGANKINVIKEVRAITGLGPQGGQGRHPEGRVRRAQEEARGGRSQGRDQVAAAGYVWSRRGGPHRCPAGTRGCLVSLTGEGEAVTNPYPFIDSVHSGQKAERR
jgi:large subunit ribosomal protein L7/L12